MKPDRNPQGYLRVSMYADSGAIKKEAIHRLVAKSWLDNPENKPCVNHIDSNPANNALSNLEWVTHQENTDHMLSKKRGHIPNAKLTEADIALIHSGVMSLKSLSETLSVTKETIIYWRRKTKRKEIFIKD